MRATGKPRSAGNGYQSPATGTLQRLQAATRTSTAALPAVQHCLVVDPQGDLGEVETTREVQQSTDDREFAPIHGELESPGEFG